MTKIMHNGQEYGRVPSTASGVAYNNTSSGLSATNVQGAIDEVNNKINYFSVVNGAVNITFDDGT